MLVGIGLCIVTLSMGALVVVMWRRHHRTKIYRGMQWYAMIYRGMQ